MAKTKKPQATLDAIRAALLSAADDYIRRVAKAHPGETPYAFLFEISSTGFSAHGAIATEEALERYAVAQLARVKPIKTADPLATIRSCFRWAGPEDGWYQQPDAAFNSVNTLLSRADAQGLYEVYSGTLAELCLSVLQELDRDGLFGTADQRERMVLGLCYIGGDNSDEEFLGWAKKVNPPSVMRRLRRELKKSRAASDLVRYF